MTQLLHSTEYPQSPAEFGELRDHSLKLPGLVSASRESQGSPGNERNPLTLRCPLPVHLKADSTPVPWGSLDLESVPWRSNSVPPDTAARRRVVYIPRWRRRRAVGPLTDSPQEGQGGRGELRILWQLRIG